MPSTLRRISRIEEVEGTTEDSTTTWQDSTPQFRQSLLEVYNYRCAITGCDAQEALEAAHIIPYSETENNHPSNGLLLRADIHTLFDLNLIAINPETMEVRFAPSLRRTSKPDTFRDWF